MKGKNISSILRHSIKLFILCMSLSISFHTKPSICNLFKDHVQTGKPCKSIVIVSLEN